MSQVELFTDRPDQDQDQDQDQDRPGLFRASSWPPGPMEEDAVATLNELHAERPFTPAQRLAGRVILALAVNIDKGNMKGRAVGNEAMQLMAALESLAGVEEGAGLASDLPPESHQFMAALASVPAAPATAGWGPDDRATG